MNKTHIEWTDYTSNPIAYREEDGRKVWGCVKVSPGCANCYAEATAKRYGRGAPFTVGAMVKKAAFVDEAELKALLSPRRLPAGSKVFVGDMTDIFGQWVTDEMLDRLFAVMALRPDVTFQLLTKRPERMREYLTRSAPLGGKHDDCECSRADAIAVAAADLGVAIDADFSQRLYPGPLANVWLGTSVENQERADARIPELLATPAAVRFLSCEPLLGAIEARQYLHDSDCWHSTVEDESEGDFRYPDHEYPCICNDPREDHISWVIVGGESGPGSRPMDVAWARSLVQQCGAAGVACFVKQLGARPLFDRDELPDGARTYEPYGEPGHILTDRRFDVRLQHRKGGQMAEWPADLRVREWPR